VKRQRGRGLWWSAAALALLAVGVWVVMRSSDATPSRVDTPASSAAASGPGAARGGNPFTGGPGAASSARASARTLQRMLWQQRLERAQTALDAYRAQTRYPFDSRPIAEHPDQVRPNEPIVEEHAVRAASGQLLEGLQLRTTQERVFVQGSEAVRFSVAVVDGQGTPVTLRMQRASARAMPARGSPTTLPVTAMDFNDEGREGDAMASDLVFGAQLQPATQGFAEVAGQIRVEVSFEVRGEHSGTFFDIFYTPQPPAVWSGGVRDAIEDGSLAFYLGAEVREAGRYVVSARVDDANGQPFALLGFNDEVGTGHQQFRLALFGKLVRDAQPALPLRLRDVEAFLLRPDTFPDRSLMPRLPGLVHTSGRYAISAFSDREWSSEERSRYLAELGRDVDEARRQLDAGATGP
jgi:hypothetical protein